MVQHSDLVRRSPSGSIRGFGLRALEIWLEALWLRYSQVSIGPGHIYYICICICTCTCMCICMCMGICTCICTWTRDICIYIYTYLYMFICLWQTMLYVYIYIYYRKSLKYTQTLCRCHTSPLRSAPAVHFTAWRSSRAGNFM